MSYAIEFGMIIAPHYPSRLLPYREATFLTHAAGTVLSQLGHP